MAHTVMFSRHAVERFCERVRPGLDIETAQQEMTRLLGSALVVADPPLWLPRAGARRSGDRYLVIADLVLPLRPVGAGERYLATTCIARGTITPATRSRRNDARRRSGRVRAQRGRRPSEPVVLNRTRWRNDLEVAWPA